MNEQFYELPQEKQMRIINAALEVFAQNDYKHAVTDEIARKAGISKGLLFYYFHNKKSLFRFLYEYSGNLIKNQVMNEQFRKITDFFELLEYAAEEKIRILERNPYLSEFVTRCFYADKEIALAEFNHAVVAATSDAFHDYFQCVDTSKFRDDVSPREIYDMLTWMIDGYIHSRQLMGKPLVMAELMDVFYRWEKRMKQIAYREEFLEGAG